MRLKFQAISVGVSGTGIANLSTVSLGSLSTAVCAYTSRSEGRILVLALLLVALGGCALEEQTLTAHQQNHAPAPTSTTSDPTPTPAPTLAPQNFFNQTPPERFCGEGGFAFLHEQYLRPQCGKTCHTVGGFSPPAFADANVTTSYQAALTIPHEALLDTVRDNGFCDDCELVQEGEVYKAIEAWSQARFNCP